MKNDRRKHPRFKIDQMLQASFDRETYIHASGINISKSGLLCKTEQEMGLYSSIFLMIRVNDEIPPVTCEGVVVRCEQEKDGTYEVGIQFTDIKNQDSLLTLTNDHIS
jgi:Tfp pilus assembly protein PilZ